MLAADLSALGPDLLPAQYAAGDAPSVRLSFQGPIDVESRDKLNQRIESAKFDGPEIRDALTRAVDQSFGAQESALGARPQVGDVLSQIPSQQTILPQMLGAEMATQLGFEATNWDTVQAESGQSATSVQADPIAGQADRLGRGDLTAFLGSLAIVAGPSRPSQPTNLTANDGRIAVGAFCTASGEEVLPDTLPADSATSDMVGEGEGASDQGSSDSASGSSSSSISVPTFEFPSFEIAKASGNLDDFVPSTQSTTSIVSTHGSFDLSSFTNPDRQADGLNWVHAIDVVWVGPDQWMFTERFLLVFNATASASLSGDLDDLKPDPNRSDSGPTTQTSSGTSTGGSDASSGDTSTGGSDAGSSDAGDGSTGPKLQETGNWSASIEIKRSTFVMFTFIASRGMSTPAAAGVKWSFDGDLSDSISLTASLSGSSTATPAPDSGDGGSGGGSSGTTTGGGSTDGSSQPGDETAPVNDVYANNYESGSSTDGGDDWDLPDDFVAQASWSAALGLTLTAVEGIHVSSTPSLKADGQVERAVALSGNYSFGGNADVDLSWTASSSSGNLIPTGGGATSPWWSPGGPTTPLPEGGDLGLDLIDVEPAIRNFDPEDPQPFNPLGDYDGYGHAMTASTGLRAAIGGAINGSFDLQGILRQGTWAEAAGHVSALLDSSFDFSGDDQFLFVFIPEPTTTPTTPHGTVTTNAKLMLRWDYTQSGDEELDASSAAELAATSDGSLGWVGSDGSILATSATGSTTDSTFDQDASSSNDAADTDVLGVDGEDLLDGEATLSGTGEFDGFDFLILNVEVIGQENWDIETGEQTQFGPIFSTGTRNNTARLDYYGANFGRGDGSYQAMASAVSDATASLSAGVGGEGYAVLDILATGGSTLSERQHANYTDIWERDAEDNSLLHLRFIDEWSSGGSLAASLNPDDSVSWSGSASADARSSVEYEQHLDSVDQAIILLGETGWDYQSLRDASFQRTANWNAVFNPYTGRFDESFTVSGDDEVHLTGYQYHPHQRRPLGKDAAGRSPRRALPARLPRRFRRQPFLSRRLPRRIFRWRRYDVGILHRMARHRVR
ncbi:MAG: hypothetical protein KatS3mg111_1717 [Pirellulaceae bacterium]|nr:MAG: hypothetical protein KatS3mg111_1717 [Pirellulaceae bacterium]